MTHAHPEVQSTCPVCQSRKVQLMGIHGILERVFLRLLRIHPFWCNDCFSRFYLLFRTLKNAIRSLEPPFSPDSWSQAPILPTSLDRLAGSITQECPRSSSLL